MATITVTGHAQRGAEPSSFVLHGRLATSGKSPKAALAALTSMQSQVKDEVPEASFEQARSFQVPPDAKHREPHRCILMFTVRVTDDVMRASHLVTALTAIGASITWVNWKVAEDHEAYREVRVAAVADARRRAEDYAVGLGRELGDLVSATDGTRWGRSVDVMSAGRARGSGPEDLELHPTLVSLDADAELTFELAPA